MDCPDWSIAMAVAAPGALVLASAAIRHEPGRAPHAGIEPPRLRPDGN
jgi:hypothetical protein